MSYYLAREWTVTGGYFYRLARFAKGEGVSGESMTIKDRIWANGSNLIIGLNYTF